MNVLIDSRRVAHLETTIMKRLRIYDGDYAYIEKYLKFTTEQLFRELNTQLIPASRSESFAEIAGFINRAIFPDGSIPPLDSRFGIPESRVSRRLAEFQVRLREKPSRCKQLRLDLTQTDSQVQQVILIATVIDEMFPNWSPRVNLLKLAVIIVKIDASDFLPWKP